MQDCRAMGLLEGHRAVVTGGASGIGRATAARMRAEGATVTIVDVDAEGAEAAAAELDCGVEVADVADPVALGSALHAAAERMGGLSALVNNAGVGNVKPLHLYTDAEWRRLLDVNLDAVFYGMRAAVPLLRANGGGSIVTNASQSGLRPTRGEAPYAAAKAAAIALTQSAALEYGRDGIRVNGVLPGFIDTPLTSFAVGEPSLAGPIEAATPLGRIGTADEVADVIVFLCSDLARYVTGQNVVVDGGSLLVNAQVDPMLSSFVSAFEPDAP